MKTDSLSSEKQGALKPGEKGFAFVLLAAALAMAWRSALLFEKSPDASGPALVPFIASLTAALAAVFVIISNIKKKSETNAGEGANTVIRYLFPANLVAAFSAIAAYCVLLKLGAPYFAVTPAFLWGLMTFYKKGDSLRNLLWTAICVAFIYLVFGLVFKVLI